MIKLGKHMVAIIVVFALIVVATVTTIVVVAHSTSQDISQNCENEQGEEEQGGEEEQTPELSKTDELAKLIANSPDIYSDYVYFIDSEGNLQKEHLHYDEIKDELESLSSDILNIISSVFGNANQITTAMTDESNTLFNKLDDLFNMLADNAQ